VISTKRFVQIRQHNRLVDGSEQRGAILEALRGARGGLDTNAVADAVGLHPNTVRWHLGLLADAGLVRSAPERRRARGRPAVVHRLTAEGLVAGRDEYRLLATMLTATVAADPDGAARAYETGRRWGHHLQAAEPGADLTELLDRQGFAAERRDGCIEMRRCPFYALAEESPQVVCTLHHGIMDGALAEKGSPGHVERLDPFVEPALCVARLGPGA